MGHVPTGGVEGREVHREVSVPILRVVEVG